jgi:signal transduction histidine kinase
VNDTQIIRENTSKTEVRAKMIALMRLALSLIALVFLAYHVSREFTPVADTYDVLLVLYCFYAAACFFAPNFIQKIVPLESAHWVDLVFFALLVYFSGGPASPIISFFVFAVLVASFRYGYSEGIKVTLVSVAVVALMHILPLPKEEEIPLFPKLTQNATLLMIGYFIACCGGLLLQQKRQLALLGEVNCMPDPRLSAEQLMGNSLEAIRAYHKADTCIAVMKMQDDTHLIFKVTQDTQKPALLGQLLDEVIATHLLAVPPQWAMSYYDGKARLSSALPTYASREPVPNVDIDAMHEHGAAIADLLEVGSFASMPLSLHGQAIGRFYLTGSNHALDKIDMLFLQQLVNEIAPRIDNIQLLDKIAATATSSMRQKIAIDLHDSTIQPYIGLKLGLEALRRKLKDDNAMAADVDELVNMTTESIDGLRQYIGGLKAKLEQPLVPAVLELAKNYQRRHGIEVAVNADSDLKVNQRLATEIYQLVCEGLSNVHRHTKAKNATVCLHYQDDQMVVQVANDDNDEKKFKQFTPRTITERVTHLGGTVSVNHHTGDKTAAAKTIVTAEIPLQLKDRRYAALA